MYVYEVPPIDAWTGWMTEEEYIASLRANSFFDNEESQMATIKALATKAQVLAKKLGWEGDRTVGPMFSGIPNEGGDSHCGVLIGWKQSNNGATFIASPYRLPWLDKDFRAVSG